jgi:hypothetical protein
VCGRHRDVGVVPVARLQGWQREVAVVSIGRGRPGLMVVVPTLQQYLHHCRCMGLWFN